MADIPLESIDLAEGEGAVGIFEVGRNRFYVVEISRFESIEDAEGYVNEIMVENHSAEAMSSIH